MNQQQNELNVIMKAKDLCGYVILVTQKSPKQYRFTFVSRMQNLCLEIIENIYLANAIWIGDANEQAERHKRLDLQHRALTQEAFSKFVLIK